MYCTAGVQPARHEGDAFQLRLSAAGGLQVLAALLLLVHQHLGHPPQQEDHLLHEDWQVRRQRQSGRLCVMEF